MNLNRFKIHLHDIVYFYIAFSTFTRLLLTTYFLESLPILSNILGKCILLLRFLLVICELFLMVKKRNSFSHYMNVLILAVLTVPGYKYTGEWLLFDVLFVVICFNNYISPKKLYDLVFKITFYFVISAIALSMLGITSNNKFYRNRDVIRYTFGFNHPNALGSHVLFLTIFYLLRKEVIKLKDIILVFASAIFIYIFPNSVAASFCMIIIGTVSLMMKIGFKDLFKFLKKKKIFIFVCFMIMIGIIGLVYAIALKGIAEEFLASLSGTFYSRFIYGKMAIDNYGLSLFGQNVEMTTKRTIILGNTDINYFNLDCTYFYLPIVVGIVPTIYYCYWYFKCMTTCVISRNTKLLGIFILMALYATSETVILSYSIYFFLGALGYENKQNKALYKKNNL